MAGIWEILDEKCMLNISIRKSYRTLCPCLYDIAIICERPYNIDIYLMRFPDKFDMLTAVGDQKEDRRCFALPRGATVAVLEISTRAGQSARPNGPICLKIGSHFFYR